MLDETRRQARLRKVEEHVASENRRDLEGIMATFGQAGEYEDLPWEDHRPDLKGVRAFYSEALRAAPDFSVEVVRRHVTDDLVVLEVVIRGTHLGSWKGLPATGRKIEFQVAAFYSFDGEDNLKGERIYYDRAAIMQQLGVLHDPMGLVGKALAPLEHPFTFARMAWQALFGSAAR